MSMKEYIQTGANALSGGIMGLALGGVQNKQNYDQANRLGRLNNTLAKEMGLFNYEQQMKMWEATNYKAQVEQLKKAGLNPGLLYGHSGPGGTTGAAPASSSGAPSVHGGDISGMMGMGLQMKQQAELLKAQTENVKADTAQKQATTAKTAGIDTQKAGVETEILKIQQDIAEKTKDKTIEGIGYQVAKTWKESSILAAEDFVAWDEDVLNARVQGAQASYLQSVLQNKQIEAQTRLTDEQAQAVSTAITQKWAEIGQGNVKLAIEAFKAEVEAAKPGLWNVLGGLAQDVVTEIYELQGIKSKAKKAK